MENQKIENVLNLALESTEFEREQSLDLGVGYNQVEQAWDVILKVTGNAEGLLGKYNGTQLLNEYIILQVPESELDEVARDPLVEYIEKPKNLYYERRNGLRTSCISPLQQNENGLYGEGVIVAVIDSGIDYMNEEFRNRDGSTRILALWDQSIMGDPPKGYRVGSEYTKEQINEAIEMPTREQRMELVPSQDFSRHGTEVTSVAAGNNGVASQAELLVVKLGTSQRGGFPRTIELMLGLNYVMEKALELQKPIAINISFGNTYGAHDGSSLLERFIDAISNLWKACICISSGNEGANAGHVSVKLEENKKESIELAVDSFQTGMNIQIWKSYEDDVEISLYTPSGEKIGPIRNALGSQRYRIEEMEILLYYGEPSPYSVLQEIYIEFIPTVDYITSGVWEIELNSTKVIVGECELWLPSAGVLANGTNFLRPNKENTITIPATASRVITVGAYDGLTNTYADFSGRGSTTRMSGIKPDLLAPGVDIIVSSVNGSVSLASGTSYAAPFVTGSAALLMEWGIVKGNDMFLYGEKVKAYLRKGAKPLWGNNPLPNNVEGFGSLCVEDSFP